MKEAGKMPSEVTKKPADTVPAKKSASRKGKKAWRKNVDTTEIEQNLGKEILEDKPSDLLFFTDTSGDGKLKEKLKFKKLKMDEILTNKSSVSAQTSKIGLKSSTVAVETLPNGKKKFMSKANKLMIEKLAKKRSAAGLGPGAAEQLKAKQKAERDALLKKGKGGYDLWNDSESSEKKDDENPLALSARPAVSKPPAALKDRPKAIPAVPIAHPGVSYRPREEDHNEAILQAAEVEFKKLDEKEKVQQALSFPPDLANMEEVFFDDSDEDDEEEEENQDANGEDEDDENRPVGSMTKRKTTAQRNRQKRARELEMEAQKAKTQKKLEKQINALHQINKQVEKELTEKEKQQLERQQKELEAEQARTKKLSRHKFKGTSMEIQLKDELADSLRTLKPEGNLFKDRFASLQQRNLIETRIPFKRKRKYKIKETESHDYKRFK